MSIYICRLTSILALDAISVSSQYQISDRLTVDFDKNIIGIGKYQNSHIGTPLIHTYNHMHSF